MLTNKEIDALTNEDRGAWIDAMTDDERMILYTALGYLQTMIGVSVVKRALATKKMTAGEQLERLEYLNKVVDRRLTAAAVAAIKPICAAGAQIVHKATQVDRTEDMIESFDLLSSWEVFNQLVALNPSLMDALRLCDRMESLARH